MFNKDKCPKCEKKVNKNNSFCSNCGKQLREIKMKKNGMLGENDFIENKKTNSNGILGNLNDKMLNKMLNGAMKMLEKEMQKGMQGDLKKMPKTKVKIMLNGKELGLNGAPKVVQNQPKKIILPKRILKNFANLRKTEPKTKLKRLGDTIIYEIELPQVESIENISIIQLESSIEIKAVSKENAYSKLIPINLPITNFNFSNEKLILEMNQIQN